MRRCCKKSKVIIFIIVLLAFGITTIWIMMQQSTNAVVLEIENAVQDDTYYVMSEHELAMEERLLLDENQVKYEEYHWNQIFDDYRLYYSPTREMSIEEYLEGYKMQNCSLPRKTQKTDTQNEKNAPEHHVQERFLLPINGVLPLFYPFNFSSILATCRKICLSVSLLLVSFSVSSFGLSVVVVAFFANPFSPAALMIAG